MNAIVGRFNRRQQQPDLGVPQRSTPRPGSWRRWVATACAAALLSGCQVQLAPAYDRALIDAITESSSDALELLATASGGTHSSTFSTREEKYSKVIGAFDALAIQAGARTVPDSRALRKVNDLLTKRGLTPLDGDLPSVTPLKKVSESVTKMRNTDRKQGVTDAEVLLFKGEVTISIDQALTYERFLER